ncbi:cobalamin biosynthesis protein [Pseudomonas sp. NPDC089554]|uniref:cobalamin biosynthesis protein n=1 Tax=Pseudomonas sp. NPDC089554 TaxID=3390653 RepID=UPI003D005B8F
MPALYAGFGCRSGCPVEALDNLLRQTLAAHQLPLSALRGIASIDSKAHEPGLLQLAERLALPLVVFTAEHLLPLAPQLSHRSSTAFEHTGCWGVAESSALALAQSEHPQARLRVDRQVLGPATLAIASRE